MELMEATVAVLKLGGPHAGRSIVVAAEPEVTVRDGRKVIAILPQLISVHVRDAESAPTGTRQKVAFELRPEGVPDPVALPLYAATTGLPGYSFEFRLEAN